jgi:hypothetical protein
VNYVARFGRFWYDFVVGDSVALAIGAVAALGVGALLVWAGADTLAEVLLPVAVVVALAISLRPTRDGT